MGGHQGGQRGGWGDLKVPPGYWMQLRKSLRARAGGMLSIPGARALHQYHLLGNLSIESRQAPCDPALHTPLSHWLWRVWGMVQPGLALSRGQPPTSCSDFLKARVGALLPLNTCVADSEPLCPWGAGASCPRLGRDTRNDPACVQWRVTPGEQDRPSSSRAGRATGLSSCAGKSLRGPGLRWPQLEGTPVSSASSGRRV